MRKLFAITALLLAPTVLQAQPEDRPKFLVKIDQVRVGFRGYGVNEAAGQFKVGLWTPVYVDVIAGPKGLPVRDPKSPPYLEFESTDSEGIGTFYRVPITPGLEPNELRTIIGYTKPGNIDTALNVGVTLHWEGKTFKAPRQVGGPLPDLGSHVYLTLGSKIPDLREALLNMSQLPGAAPQDFNNRDTGPRYAAFESEVRRLPEHWFGYQGVDLLILTTDRKDLLTELLRDANRPRLQAIAQWVRLGGRLVIPVNHQNQDLLARLLQSPVWQPPVPVVPPENPGDVQKNAPKRLEDVEVWANTRGKPFPGPGAKAIPIAKLNPGQVALGIWDIQAKTEDGRPLIATMPYGRGNITYIAFSLEDTFFKAWDGRLEFLSTLFNKFAYRVNQQDRNFNQRMGRFDDGGQNDIATNIHRELENFDVNVVPFGFVALFILLYILVVGPLDYFILKHVFHKLELTWITFPIVVVSVSVAAYFTAYALKGSDLKINKIDIIDFDLRSELDGKERTARAFAYGQTYFTILSPRIQNYTVGVEPNPVFWGGKSANPLSADQVSWMGRPEFDGYGAMGRSGSQSFLRRPYSYAEDANGLRDVPIPVWTTKAFEASWEMPLAKIPIQADLAYHTREFEGRNVKLTGTIKNDLGVDLEDVWIIFGERCYQIPGIMKCTANGGGPTKLEGQNQKEFQVWLDSTSQTDLAARAIDFRSVQGNYNPTRFVRQAMFLDKFSNQNPPRNHNMRNLDFTWRLQKDQGQGETRLREAILYAHVAFQRGSAETMTLSVNPLPTNLWLGELPLSGQPRPALVGTLAQDTFIRVLVPVRLSPQ